MSTIDSDAGYPPFGKLPDTLEMTACEVLCWIAYGRAIPKDTYYRPIGPPPPPGMTEAGFAALLLHRAVPDPKPADDPMDRAERTLMEAIRYCRLRVFYDDSAVLREVPAETFGYALCINARGGIEADQGAAERDRNRARTYRRSAGFKPKGDVVFRTEDVRRKLAPWPGGSDFEPLVSAIEPWFDKPLNELPAELQQRVNKLFPIPWDRLGPAQRREVARQSDLQRHPGLARETYALLEAVWEARQWELVGAHIPVERQRATDLAVKKAGLKESKEDVTAAEAALEREAESLGLGLPDLRAETHVSGAGRSRTNPDTPQTSSRRGVGGRPPKYDWNTAREKLRAHLEAEGAPKVGDGGQAELVRFVQDIFGPDNCPADSAIKTMVKNEIEAFRRTLC